MDALFGIPLSTIMIVLLVLLAVAVGSVAFVAWRNQIMFKMGVRNLPRRRAQTILVVLGLMLSTIIISAAFTTGDTVDRSITSQVYTQLGSVDELIVPTTGDEDDELEEGENQIIEQAETFPSDAVAPVLDDLRANEQVDAVVPAYADVAVAVNLEERLSSPLFNLLGIQAESIEDLSDLQTPGGESVSLQDLGENEIYVNEAAAKDLNVEPGDTITLFSATQSVEVVVREVIADNRLGGAAGVSMRREGGVMPLSRVQEFFGNQGQLTQVFVSNAGDARGGVGLSDEVEASIEASLMEHGLAGEGEASLEVNTVKETGVEFAEQGANLFTTFFLVLGLFSIGAGVLLIFMIFVMLAAERKSEMGMARAIGTKRMDLVQTFLAEGMAYNLLAAMVGTAIGILVAFGIAEIMASIFADLEIDISPYVTLQSILISYSLGVVLTFLTVTASSWRVSQINIVSAIRDVPEPAIIRPLWGSTSFWDSLRNLVFKPADRAGWIRRGVTTVALVLAIAGGAIPILLILAVLLYAGVLISHAWSRREMPALFRVAIAIASILIMPISLIAGIFMALQLGPMFTLLSLPLIAIGASELNAFALLFGLSLLPLGLAFIARSFGANERFVYTLVGVILIYIWEIDFSVGLLEAIFGEAQGDIELFFLSGVMVTLAATFLIVYNADILLTPLTRLGRGLGAFLPSLKMAIAYPLASKMRTGMTMAMFCLVVFALTVISSMNHNFNRLFLSDRALGGFDITVDENPNSPIDDLGQALEDGGSGVLGEIEAIAVTSIAGNALVCQPESAGGACNPEDTDDYVEYLVRGEDEEFFEASEIALQARAAGFETDEAVWQAVAEDPSLAVIDSFALSPDFGQQAVVSGIDPADQSFEPAEVIVRDSSTGEETTLRVIGVIELGASASYTGLHVNQSVFNQVFGEPDIRRFYLQTADGTNNLEVVREIESTLLTTGAQAESLRQQLDEQSSLQTSFLYLMQGFMGLGLFVGVAAVGVIAFRTVVERRQQIGMLRALGYTRNMIGMTFLMESAFIAFMGILSGVVFALILARQLITEEFANQGVTSFSVPWIQILVIAGLAFGFALLMTLIPSRQAASIPIAEALRYE